MVGCCSRTDRGVPFACRATAGVTGRVLRPRHWAPSGLSSAQGGGIAIRPITAGRAIGGGDRRRAGPARSPSALPESAGSSHRQSAREHWRCCCQRTRCGRDREPSEETSRSRRRSDLLASSGSSNKNSTGRLRMPMHESEIGIRTGKLRVADRGELHTTKPPFAETRFRQAIADGLAGEQAAAGASAASTIE